MLLHARNFIDISYCTVMAAIETVTLADVACPAAS
jgi:hypothetical protein